MSDKMGKRKYAGPTIGERRKTDSRDKRHLSPHEKPRTWTLTIEWSETSTYRREKTFTTRAARDESRRRIERHFAEKSKEAEKPKKYRRWWVSNSPFSEYSDQLVATIKNGPFYTEGPGTDTEGNAK